MPVSGPSPRQRHSPRASGHLHGGSSPCSSGAPASKPHCCRVAASAALLRERLRSAAQHLKGAQQKSCIHMKQHTGQVASVKTVKQKTPFACKQKSEQGQIFLLCFYISGSSHYGFVHRHGIYKVPYYKRTALLLQQHGV